MQEPRVALATQPHPISMTLPPQIDEQVRSIASRVGIGVEKTVVVLLKYGLEAMQAKEAKLADLSERLHVAQDSGERDRLGDELGREIFG